MHRNRIGFWLLALDAAVLAACSTGGGGGTIVPQGFQSLRSAAFSSFAGGARHRRHSVRAVVYLRIPAPRHHHRGRRQMHPNYVSPGTASISFAVQPIAASGPQPTPMPLQTMNVTTPSPCARYPSSKGALQCKFTVSVMPGRDSFVVKTYAGAGASGNVLSEYTSGSTIVPTPNPKGAVAPLGFTLEGVIDHVVLQYPNSVVPADTKGQVGAIPVGVATTAPLNVTPYDAANYQILSQVPATGTPVPYAAPVTLSVTPAGKGMTLSNASGSGNTVTISNPNDLNVNIVYSGAFTASGGAVSSTTSFSIAATGTTLALRSHKIDLRAPRAATPAPNAAGIALSGNAIPGGTVTTTTIVSPVPAGLVKVPGSNTLAFFANGYDSTFAYQNLMGTANGGVATTSGQVVNLNLFEGYADSLGNLWQYDYGTGNIVCFASGSFAVPAGSIPSATLVPGGMSASAFTGFAQDSSNDLWFALYGSNGTAYFETIGYVPVNAGSCSSPAAVVYQALPPTDQVATLGIAAIPGTGSVQVASYDSSTLTPSVLIAATAAPTPNVTSVALAGSATPGPFIGGPGSVYALMGSSVLGSVSPAGSFTAISTYTGDEAAFLSQITGTAAAPSGVGLTAYNGNYTPYDFVLLVDPTDGNASTDLQALQPANQCHGVAFDAQDTAWTLCTNAQNVLQFYHIVPTSTWSLLPGTTVPLRYVACAAPLVATTYLGVLEKFGSTAGPFSLTNYNTSVISGVTQVGDRGIALTVTEPSPGTYVENADVVDANGRSVPVTLDIDAILQACAPPRHGAQAPARRGYPPVSHN